MGRTETIKLCPRCRKAFVFKCKSPVTAPRLLVQRCLCIAEGVPVTHIFYPPTRFNLVEVD